METCVRGFSYMPEDTQMEVLDLQYIEGEELERTWKATRRQRLKEREQKVWEEFVREQDVVKTMCKEDPYQFLQQLPENCIKDLLDIELKKMKKKQEKTPEIASGSPEQPQQGDGDSYPVDNVPNTNNVQEDEKDDGPMFHIYNDNVSGGEEDMAVSTPSLAESAPNTVREKYEDVAEPNVVPLAAKSSENLANVIEKSIYCARVKDLRLRIYDEIGNAIAILERLEVMSLERGAARRARRRAAEFCSRYHTQRLYPLQRQIADIDRVNNYQMPFGKHTQFQSLMVRLVSLHQNVQMAFQVLLRNFEHTFWLEECSSCVRMLLDFTRRAASFLHPDQELLGSCDKLEEALNEYVFRVTNFFNTESEDSSSKKKKRKMRPLKSARGKEPDGRLSMYSMDTLRLHSSKSSSVKGVPPGSAGIPKIKVTTTQKNVEKQNLPSTRKSPRCRRPLMRAPRGGPRAPPVAPDVEVPTMVEDTCLSSHMSRVDSPRSLLSPQATPRSPTKPQKLTPRQNTNTTNLSKLKLQRPNSSKGNKNSTTTKPNSPSKPAPKQPEVQHPTHVEKNVNTENTSTDVATETPVKCPTIDISDERKLLQFKSTVKGLEKFGNEDAQVELKIIDHVNNNSQELSDGAKSDRGKNKVTSIAARCEVTRLLKQLCSGGEPAVTKTERTGAKNAQLHCVKGSSPRPPSTPQLLRILEETIQQKIPKPMHKKTVRDPEKYRLMFNIPERTANNLFQYRTKFVQHMLASAMYANSTIGKPWEIIGTVSEQIVDELLAGFATEFQMKDIIDDLYRCETN